MSSVVEELRLRCRNYGKIYIGGSLARTLLGIDNSFSEDSDIDLYIFASKPICLDGYVYGHRISCTYIPIEYHDKLIYSIPPGARHYPVVDLDLNPFYILDLSYIFSVVVDDEYED